MEKHKITIDKEKCIGCQMCIQDCPAKNIKLNNQKAEIIDDECIMCGHCVAICPKNAVSISGYEESKPKPKDIQINPEQILNTIRFRRTIRQFQKKEIDSNILESILEAGRLTHTAKKCSRCFICCFESRKR